MTFRYFDYLSHFVGGLLLSYSYFIFSLNFEQPQNIARGNFSVRTDCVAISFQSTAIVSANVVLNDIYLRIEKFGSTPSYKSNIETAELYL